MGSDQCAEGSRRENAPPTVHSHPPAANCFLKYPPIVKTKRVVIGQNGEQSADPERRGLQSCGLVNSATVPERASAPRHSPLFGRQRLHESVNPVQSTASIPCSVRSPLGYFLSLIPNPGSYFTPLCACPNGKPDAGAWHPPEPFGSRAKAGYAARRGIPFHKSMRRLLP